MEKATLPILNKNDKSEKAATDAFIRSIDINNAFILQKADIKDYGKDLEIEVVQNFEKHSSPTNIRVQVQLKGTETNLNNDSSLSFPILSTNINYLNNYLYAIYICYHIPSDTLFVRDVDDIVNELFEKYGEKWVNKVEKPSIKFNTKFDIEYQNRLKQITTLKNKNIVDNKKISTEIDCIEEYKKLKSIPNDKNKAYTLLKNLFYNADDKLILDNYEVFKSILYKTDLWVNSQIFLYSAIINANLNSITDNPNIELVKKSVIFFKQLDIKENFHSLGNGYLILGNIEDAKNAFQLCIENTKNKEIIAKCYKDMVFCYIDDVDKQIEILKTSLKFDSNTNEIYWSLANIYLNLAINLKLDTINLECEILKNKYLDESIRFLDLINYNINSNIKAYSIHYIYSIIYKEQFKYDESLRELRNLSFYVSKNSNWIEEHIIEILEEIMTSLIKKHVDFSKSIIKNLKLNDEQTNKINNVLNWNK